MKIILEQNIKISVIIPVYNSEKSIERCLYSIQKQDYKNYEVLCVDDGSVDNSESIILKLSENDSRIHLLKKKHSGQSATRNFGICAAKGEYVLFVDSDDTISKYMLSHMLKEAINTSADLVISGFKLIQNGKVNSNCIPDKYSGGCSEFMEHKFQKLYSLFLINAPWNKLIKRDLLIEKHIIFNEKMRVYEDLKFSLEVIENSKIISTVNEELYKYYYMQNGSVLSSYSKEMYVYIYIIGDKMEELMQKYTLNNSEIYADLIHKMFAFASIIRKQKEFSSSKKIWKMCVIFSNKRMKRYLKYAKTDDNVLMKKIKLLKYSYWLITDIKLCGDIIKKIRNKILG